MKRFTLILAIGVLCLGSQTMKAQWVVTDPTNLVQNIISATQGTTTAANMINNLKESIKIYEQGKEYYDKLKSVHGLIKDAKKVKKTVELVSQITNIYVNGFNKIVSDPNFTADELIAISSGYTILLEEGGILVSELKEIITAGNGLSMSDKERMDIIDNIYNKMLTYRNLTRYYTNRNISISFIRSKEKNDTERVRALYGSPSERYW